MEPILDRRRGAAPPPRSRNNNVYLVKNAPNLQIAIDSGSFQKSKLVATYLTLPLAFQVNFSNDASNGLHLRAGIDLNYLVGSYNKRDKNRIIYKLFISKLYELVGVTNSLSQFHLPARCARGRSGLSLFAKII